MTTVTVTGGPSQVSAVLSGILNRLAPKAPKAVLSPDTLAYQYEVQNVKPAEHLMHLVVQSSGRVAVVQGCAESKRIVLLLPEPVSYSEAEVILAAMITARSDGHTMGFEDGWAEGYDKGHSAGTRWGEKKGYDKALSELDR